MAPEVAKRGEAYNHKADIWSLGITLIELVDGVPPLSELNAYRVMLAIQKNDPPSVQNPKEMSHVFMDFLSKCLVKDYNLRWDTLALIKHPFVINSKRSDIKDLLEKTLKRREVHKRNQVPLIDHTDLESPRFVPAADPVFDDHTDTYVQLETSSGPIPSDSMILHNSTPLLPDPAAQEPISVEIKPEILLPKQEKSPLAWQQPGYSSKDTEEGRTIEYSPSISNNATPRTSEASPLLSPKTPAKQQKDESSYCPCCPSSCTIL